MSILETTPAELSTKTSHLAGIEHFSVTDKRYRKWAGHLRFEQYRNRSSKNSCDVPITRD